VGVAHVDAEFGVDPFVSGMQANNLFSVSVEADDWTFAISWVPASCLVYPRILPSISVIGSRSFPMSNSMILNFAAATIVTRQYGNSTATMILISVSTSHRSGSHLAFRV
jgi:hypothetical protein